MRNIGRLGIPRLCVRRGSFFKEKEKAGQLPGFVAYVWCGREDLNLHGLNGH